MEDRQGLATENDRPVVPGAPVDSIRRLVAMAAGHTGDAIAVRAPGRPPLTYDRLLRAVDAACAAILADGVPPGARIAIALPPGPELAVAVLAAASAGSAAPLNPASTERELRRSLDDLGPAALIVAPASDTPARDAAGALGLRLLELPATDAGDPDAAASDRGGDDVALVLHTSGTTSRPKTVPLTHANLCASARNVRDALGLTAGDLCLDVMPLFHVHGLVAGVLASIAAGAGVVCPPAFSPSRFWSWMDELAPTWYTASPSLHQAIAAHAPPGLACGTSLRFVRSCSASLPAVTRRHLESLFRVPVVEAYGMTEAAHQVTSQRPADGSPAPGSVGVAVGTEVAVVDDNAALLPAGSPGEVVVRGPNVMRGYAGDAEVDRSAFAAGWFRTGDRGHLDAAGRLHLSGRIKEIVNCGGEKVAPAEVDEVLLEHPDVRQAAAFGVPDARLGERVAAAVVLDASSDATERDLRRFVADRLAPFKVPARIVFVDELPRGATGKVQRLQLGAELGFVPRPGAAPEPAVIVAPRTPLEARIAAVWAAALGGGPVGVTTDFFDLGGSSLLAEEIVARLRDALGVQVGVVDLLDGRTVAGLAEELAGRPPADPGPPAG